LTKQQGDLSNKSRPKRTGLVSLIPGQTKREMQSISQFFLSQSLSDYLGAAVVETFRWNVLWWGEATGRLRLALSLTQATGNRKIS